MGYISRVKDGVGTHLVEPTLYAVAGGTSAAYTAAISNFELVEGTVIHIKFVATNSAAATLNVNNTGAKNILYEGETLVAGALVSNRIYSFVCTKDNDVWYWEMINDLPTDDKLPLSGGELTGNLNIKKTSPYLTLHGTDSTATTLTLERSNDDGLISSWRWVNSSGTLTLQNNWTSGTYFDVVKYHHTTGDVDIEKTLSIGQNITITGNIVSQNATSALGTVANPFHNIVLGGEVTATMTAASTNPRITFQGQNNGAQQVHLIYSNIDSYRAPAGLKIIGENTSGDVASPAWLEVEGNIYASAFKGNADSATTAARLTANTSFAYGDTGLTWFDISGTAGTAVQVNDTPTTAWWHILRFNHSNSNAYYTDLAIPFNAKSLYYKRITGGSVVDNKWVKVLDEDNYSSYAVKKTGDTMSGELTLSKANAGNNFGVYVEHTNPNSNTANAKKVGLMVGGASGSGGIYDVTKGKWIVYSDTAGNVTLNGNALTATNVAWSGITSNPITFGGTITYGTTGWKQLGGRVSQSSIVVSKPADTVTWGTTAHSAAITFGCNDTKGMLDIAYSSPLVSIAGGNNSGSTDSEPKWYFKFSATSGATYTLPNATKTLAASDGSNATGTWGISISGKAGSVDWANTGHPTTFPPSTHDHDSRYALKEHAHGNITSDGKMSGSTVSGAVTTAHKFLREDGTWVVPKYTTDTDTHYTTKLIAGGSAATSNAAVTSGNVYLRLFDNSTHRNNIQLAAGSNMTITSDVNGIITFKSSYTNNAATHTPSQTTQYYITGTTSSTSTTSGDTYDIDLYTTTTPGELSALRYSLHYGSVEKAHLIYNNTDDSIDFVFV